ncbi:MAG: HDOD domain-containing protein [candidate division Zixibacteria bacterium]|nr:HDOD domain-containing protein [candidate division Zixibacteria bacterium]
MPAVKTEERGDILEIIRKIEELPSPKFILEQINRVLNNPHSSAIDIGNIIAEDVSTSAKILKMANSAYYSLPYEVSNVKQAVMIIGLQTLKSVVLTSSVMDTFKGGKALDKEYTESFWRHSLSAAILSKIIARRVRPSDLEFHETAFSAGILHDIGKMIIAAFLPGIHQNKLEYLNEYSVSEFEAEHYVINRAHNEIGRYLAETWKLPRSVADVIYFHHNPASTPGDSSLVYITHLSDFLIHDSGQSNYYGYSRHTTLLDERTYGRLNLEENYKDKLMEDLNNEYSKAETFLRFSS